MPAELVGEDRVDVLVAPPVAVDVVLDQMGLAAHAEALAQPRRGDILRVEAGETTRPAHVAAAPTLFVSQRLGRRFAIGVGGFTNFAEHFDYPTGWIGRYQGQYLDLTTYTFNPVVSVRPIERLSIAVGLTITPASAQVKQAVNFGGADEA